MLHASVLAIFAKNSRNIFFKNCTLLPICTKMTPNPVGIYVTTTCDMASVELSVSEKSPRQTSKWTRT